jgi:branched-chain amino acid transport system ATP-binding protein
MTTTTPSQLIEEPAMAERTGLVATGIDMSFGGNKALNGVHISLASGQWTGLIGPNGSGKTTMLNVLSGVYVAKAGEILLNGEDVTGQRPGRLSRAGIVRTFQHPQLAEDLSLWENVLLGVDLRGRRRPAVDGTRQTAEDEARVLMEIFDCAAYADHLPAHAPYGARKIAEIVRAVVARPAVLLLDEPAAGLSREERVELVKALSRVRELHPEMAVCLVEHDVRLVAAVCSQIQVLNFGMVLAVGNAREVLKEPAVIEAYLGKSASRIEKETRE